MYVFFKGLKIEKKKLERKERNPVGKLMAHYPGRRFQRTSKGLSSDSPRSKIKILNHSSITITKATPTLDKMGDLMQQRLGWFMD